MTLLASKKDASVQNLKFFKECVKTVLASTRVFRKKTSEIFFELRLYLTLVL